MENYKRLSSDEMREQHVSKFKQRYENLCTKRLL